VPANDGANANAKRIKAAALTELGEQQISAIARNLPLLGHVPFAGSSTTGALSFTMAPLPPQATENDHRLASSKYLLLPTSSPAFGTPLAI
jgi:hypothetical protein